MLLLEDTQIKDTNLVKKEFIILLEKIDNYNTIHYVY